MRPLHQATKISWALLPEAFRRIWLELQVDSGRTKRGASIGYILVAPLTENGRIDIDLWRQFHEFCGVIRLRPKQPDDVGHLVRQPDGMWAFRYDVTGEQRGERAYCILSERFVAGGHVSISDDAGLHLFHVAAIEPI
jgi:hypothetical protein